MADSKKKFRALTSSLPDAWTPTTKGQTMEGVFLGAVQVPAKRTHADGVPYFLSYRFRLTAPLSPVSDKVKSKAAGDVVCVAGAMLSTKMDQVPTGAAVQLTYKGKVVVGRGSAHDFDVALDEDAEALDPHAATGEV